MSENLNSKNLQGGENQAAVKAEPAGSKAPVTASAAPTYKTAASAQQPIDDEYTRAQAERTRRKELVKEAARGVAAWVILPLTFIFGVLVCELVVRPFASGIGLTIVTLAAYALYSSLMIKRDRSRVRPMAALGVPVLLLSLSFALNASLNGRIWMVLLLIGLCMMLNAVMSGCTRSTDVFSADTLADAAYINMIAPFANIGAAFGGLFSHNREDEGGSKAASKIGKVIIGLVISIPVVLILGLALVSADAVFEDFIRDIAERIEKLDISFGRIIGDMLVGALACLIGIPLVISLRSGYVKERGRVSVPRWLDPVIGATVAYAAGAVYLLFVVVQISYFFPVSISYYFGNHDFSKRLTLPDNMTWAEYARSGFFELSGIIIASFLAIAAFMAFARRNKKGELPVYLKIALSMIAGCNIVMSVSAVMRMGLYTIWCGLTAKRIGVLLIIAVIAISLAAVIIKLWMMKFPLVRVVGITALCAAVGFGCMNVERVCAEVNVSRHIEQGTSIDMTYLGELSCAAAPAVERLMEQSPDEDVRAAAQGLIARYYYLGHGPYYNRGDALIECDFGEMTLDHWHAYDMCFRDTDGDGREELWVTKDMVNDYSIYADWQQEKRDHESWHSSEYMSFEEFRETYQDRWYYDSYYSWGY